MFLVSSNHLPDPGLPPSPPPYAPLLATLSALLPPLKCSNRGPSGGQCAALCVQGLINIQTFGACVLIAVSCADCAAHISAVGSHQLTCTRYV